MTIVTFRYEDMISLIGSEIEKKELIEKIPMIGVGLEKVDGDEISIEVFPNRPDMFSVEGIARALRAFFGIERGLKKYDVKDAEIEIKVDRSVKGVRPFIVGCVIRNVEFNDESIASLMELQEKLHLSIGKGRKKMAIGVHDFDKVEPPFLYKGVKPHEIKFVPLGMEEELSLDEILEKHEKGIEYAHLVRGEELYPLLVDKNGNVLSFPPIINGQLTAVNYATKNIFIDVTGTDEKAVNQALNIIATSLAERGGRIEKVKIIDEKEKITPDLTPFKNEIKLDYVRKVIGIDLDIKDALERMGHDVVIEEGKAIVYSPAWRTDILHPVDLIEDAAIGYGYGAIPFTLPKHVTFGSSFEYRKIHDTMLGLGFDEVLTLSLSSKEKEFQKMELEEKNVVEIANPISSHHSIVRPSLIPSLLEILSSNRHNDLPQSIYELGNVVLDGMQKTMLAGVKIAAKTGFTECKSIVEAILRNFGYKMEVEEEKNNAFMEGRCASVLVDGEKIGYFGEIKPSVITAFELEYPVIAFEIDASFLLSSK